MAHNWNFFHTGASKNWHQLQPRLWLLELKLEPVQIDQENECIFGWSIAAAAARDTKTWCQIDVSCMQHCHRLCHHRRFRLWSRSRDLSMKFPEELWTNASVNFFIRTWCDRINSARKGASGFNKIKLTRYNGLFIKMSENRLLI